jgi:hypothetical protein
MLERSLIQRSGKEPSGKGLVGCSRCQSLPGSAGCLLES